MAPTGAKVLRAVTLGLNNTDAEGRLVLADGVNWAATSTNSDVIIDIATLTGAAPVAVGKNFAALYSNDPELERTAVVAGRKIGEPCHPLPYTPELYFQEFASAVVQSTDPDVRWNQAMIVTDAGQAVTDIYRQRREIS